MKTLFSLFAFVLGRRSSAKVTASLVMFVVSSSLVAQQVQPPEVEDVEQVWATHCALDCRAFSFDLMALDPWGNICTAGMTTGPLGSVDFSIVKFSSAGDVLWDRTYAGPLNDDDRPTGLVVDDLCNIYVTGYISNYNTGGGMNFIRRNFATIKYDPDGKELWVRQWGTNIREDYPSGIIMDSKKNVIVAGFSFVPDVTLPCCEVFDAIYVIVKYDPSGQELWSRTLKLGNYGAHQVSALTLDTQDNILITGSAYVTSDLSCSDYLTAKYSPNGSLLWTAIYQYTGNGNCMDKANAVITDNQDNVYVTGYSYSGWYNALTVKYSPTGKQLWSRRFSVDGIRYSSGNFLALDSTDGSISVIGSSYDGNSTSFLTIKYSSEGQEIWTKSYDFNIVNSKKPTGIAIDGQGNLYLAGSMDSPIGSLVLKYSRNGTLCWDTSFIGQYSALAICNSIAVGDNNAVYIAGRTCFPDNTCPATLIRLNQVSNPPSPTPLHFYNTAKTPAAWEQLQPPYTVEKFNPEYPTAVLVHGWNSNDLASLNDLDDGKRSWMLLMADEIYSRLDKKVNILAWDWLEDAKGSKFNLSKPASKVTYNSILLSVKLKQLFESTSYPKEKDLHIMGHSFGAFLSIFTGTNLSRFDWHKPAQISLFDIADLASAAGVNTAPREFDEFIYVLRSQYQVYFDLYHGVTSEGDHGCNVWIDVPQGSFNPLNWHFVYEWYQYTVNGAVNPKIFTSLGWFEKNPLVGTLGFEMSPLGLKSRPLNMCGLDKLETLLYMKPMQRISGVWWDPDDFVQIGQRCTSFTPLVNNGPMPITLGTFAGDGSGAKLTDTSIRMTTGSPIAFTLPVTINTAWDYMKFSYNFISAPQKSELTLTLHRLSNNEKQPLFYMASDAALNLGWSDTGPLYIADIHGETVEFIFEFTSLAPNAVIEIKDLAFLTEAGHSMPRPKADAGPDTAIKADGSGVNSITLDASASEGENLRFWWTQNNLFLIEGVAPEIHLALGAYELGLIVKDDFDRASEDSVIVEIEYEFTRGDANADGQADITDAIAILEWLFLKSTAPLCQDAADIDDNATVDLSDPINLLYFLFLGKAAPKPPYPTAGLDPTPDMLGCDIKLK